MLRDLGERTERAALDAELANSERFAEALSSRLVGLQTGMRGAAGKVPIDDLGNTDALISYLDQNVVLRSMFDNVFIAAPNGGLLVGADENGIRASKINAADRPYFRKTLDDGRSVIS